MTALSRREHSRVVEFMSGLEVEPEYDPCFMPTGGGLCMLPGTHLESCLPLPPCYPPLPTVVVES